VQGLGIERSRDKICQSNDVVRIAASRSFFQECLDRVAAYHQTDAYTKAYQKRKVWVGHCLEKASSRGLATLPIPWAGEGEL
jgi:hypothetical protein